MHCAVLSSGGVDCWGHTYHERQGRFWKQTRRYQSQASGHRDLFRRGQRGCHAAGLGARRLHGLCCTHIRWRDCWYGRGHTWRWADQHIRRAGSSRRHHRHGNSVRRGGSTGGNLTTASAPPLLRAESPAGVTAKQGKWATGRNFKQTTCPCTSKSQASTPPPPSPGGLSADDGDRRPLQLHILGIRDTGALVLALGATRLAIDQLVSGALSGTIPAGTMSFSYTVKATNGITPAASKKFTVTVHSAPEFTPDSPPTKATVGKLILHVRGLRQPDSQLLTRGRCPHG